MASEALVGRAIESLVAAAVVLGSDTRLNVLTAMADDAGVDLVFQKRGCASTLAVQVKGRRLSSRTIQKGTFRQEVRRSTFDPRRDLALLFVAVDGDRATIERGWLIASEEFDSLALPVSGGQKLRIQAAMNVASRDKWSRFRIVPTALAGEVESRIDALEAAR